MRNAYPLLVLSFQLLTGCESLSVSNDTHNGAFQKALLLVASKSQRCPIPEDVIDGRYLATGLPSYYSPPPLTELSMIKEESLWQILAKESTLPVPNNARVRNYKQWYLNRPLHLKTVSKRAQPFLYYIYQNAQSRDLPIELVLLPFIESAFDPYAYSQQGAAGLWQITKPTGKSFGLQFRPGYDGRLDIIASTQAALDLLEYLHHKFNGNWLHAIAAYNSGEGRVRKAIKANKALGKPTDFWSLALPRETEHYVPKLLALSQIIKEESHTSLPLVYIPNSPVLTSVTITQQVPLAQIASDAGLTGKALYLLNPGYSSGLTLRQEQSQLLIPKKQLNHFYKQPETLHYVKNKYSVRHIEPGDSLYKLATLNNTSISDIKQANQLVNNKIHAGQLLLIPVK
ncbi:transglycosylase SLT domain-containing protein [Photobacterium halotolerans]|uniref:Transglycosylase SLT domain-containing protein n=1 Tax=Photobacterium halotolerans TaxID=265726 RepID=A0A7X4WPK1_9GAMM|nr:transglycosylase SLT domain-containing protein [Photobacterium halotolerans]NAW66097.1 transglycosylase SLT domain-containing protein [Photobacterium halotolerans]NAW86488.1 transglycosylase SLT domain-containing protein [Photobacterium halotolerans]